MKKRLWITILIFLILIGIVSLYASAKLNENNKYKLYRIDFSISANTTPYEPPRILDYTLNYNFKENKGNFSWWLNYDNWTLEKIIIELPTEIKEKNINIYLLDKNETKKELESELRNYKGYSKIFITDSGEYGKEKFIIEFEPKQEWIPEGRYHFYKEENIDIPEGKIHFNMENKYSCETPCIYPIKNIQEEMDNNEKEIILKLNWAEKDLNGFFKINTTNRNKLFLKNIFASLGISILVSVIITFLTLLNSFQQKPKASRKKR